MRVILVINEQHTLMEQQAEALAEFFGEEMELVRLLVPSSGWNAAEQRREAERLVNEGAIVVFASPVPLLMATWAWLAGQECGSGYSYLPGYVLHNDNREKVENGRGVFYKVAKAGWKLEGIHG